MAEKHLSTAQEPRPKRESLNRRWLHGSTAEGRQKPSQSKRKCESSSRNASKCYLERRCMNIPINQELHPKIRKRGRPRKDIDHGILFHMVKNSAPIKAIACYFSVHRDTIYANFPDIIKEAQASYNQSLRVIQEITLIKWLKEKRMKEAEKQAAKRKKRRYRRCFFYGRYRRRS